MRDSSGEFFFVEYKDIVKRSFLKNKAPKRKKKLKDII